MRRRRERRWSVPTRWRRKTASLSGFTGVQRALLMDAALKSSETGGPGRSVWRRVRWQTWRQRVREIAPGFSSLPMAVETIW